MTAIEAVKILKAHGINATMQRRVIAQIMLSKKQHLTAEQVLQACKLSAYSVSRATVYNTLHKMVQNHLINEVSVDSKHIYFDSNTKPHYHFYDVYQRKLIDIPRKPGDLLDLPVLPEAYSVEQVSVIIHINLDK